MASLIMGKKFMASVLIENENKTELQPVVF